MYLLCKVRSINLEVTRETKVVDPPLHFVDSLFADYNFLCHYPKWVIR